MRRSSLFAGVILILAGLFFLLPSFFPNVFGFLNIEQHWPLIIVGVGALFLIGALFGTPPLAVPGSIITGLGLLFYYQNLNDAWTTWSYAWTLIPGFAGIGTLIMYGLQGEGRLGLREGGRLIAISLILFLVFGALFGGLVTSGVVWALVLIGLGLWLLVRTILGGRSAG